MKKEITLNSLAELVVETKKDLIELIETKNSETRKALEEKIDSSAEHLAALTQSEFVRVNTKIDNLEGEVKNRRVHVFNHKDLEHRVEKLEEDVEKLKPCLGKLSETRA